MDEKVISHWLDKTRARPASETAAGVQVIRREKAPPRGQIIMEMAEKLRPWIASMFENVRDDNGMLVQPSRVRGIALNVAQRIVHEQELKAANG
jgi:hypothetical protein